MDLTKQRYYDATRIGMSAKTLLGGSVVTSSSIDCETYNQLTVECALTYVNATAVLMYIEETSDLSGTPTWRRVQTVSASGGTITSNAATWSQAIAAASENWVWNTAISYKAIRLVFDATAGTTDTITVNVRLSRV